VSKVLESSAANFAGVLEGDILLQVDDRVVSVKDDIVRYFLVFFPHRHREVFSCLFPPLLPICSRGGRTPGPRSFQPWLNTAMAQ
jgi:hypothetical protein